MDIIQDFIKLGRPNRPGRLNPMRFITIHETGNTNPGADALRHAAWLHGGAVDLPVSWHYTPDDTRIVQHLPDNEDAFHAGDGAGQGNRESIGIEICVNSDGDFPKAIYNASWLVAELCHRHKIPLENVVQHHRWNKKNCPQQLRAGRPFGWDAFLTLVNEQLNCKTPPVSISFGTALHPIKNTRLVNDRWVTQLPHGQKVAIRDVLEAWGFKVDWQPDANAIIVLKA